MKKIVYQKNAWEKNAKEDAFWSILTDPNKRNKWNLNEFFATGEEFIDEFIDHGHSVGVHLGDKDKVALDFGCGVGRLTQALANHYGKVIGVDISPTMVELANLYNDWEINCQYILNQEPNLSRIEDHSIDLVFSYLVLQHISPKDIRSYLKEFFRIVKPDGYIVFQLPSEMKDNLSLVMRLRIRYNLDYYINNIFHLIGMKEKPLFMELHGIRREEVEKIINDNGGIIIEIVEDNSVAAFNSWVYWVFKEYH